MGNLFRRIRKYHILLLCVTVVLILDQLTKLLVMRYIPFGTYNYPEPIPVIKGFFYLVHIGNTGSAWGMFENLGLYLAIFALVAVTSIFLFRKMLMLHLLPMQIVFGLMIGGILGNFLDRIFVKHVVDFIDIHLPFYRWPAFNVADSAICVGVIAYIGITFWLDRKSKDAEKR